ncbi:hypothetical protein J7432_21035 [Xanthomonas axonopodis pv. begoniae]|nr:hypothetical protein [Xanthomonas axonopodis pv. begoniae]
MTIFSERFAGRTFREITLPASHDTGMFVLGGTVADVLAISRITKTQTLNITDQVVSGGVRVLDLRPVYYEADSHSNVPSGYYCAHWSRFMDGRWVGLVGCDWDSACLDLANALSGLDSGEVLVVTLGHGASLAQGGQHGTLDSNQQCFIVKTLLEHCEEHLFLDPLGACVDFFGMSVSKILGSQGRAKLFVALNGSSLQDCGFGPGDGCFPPSVFQDQSTWGSANTDDADKFYAMTCAALEGYVGQGSGPVNLAWHMTWSPPSLRSLKDYAEEINPQLKVRLTEWLQAGVFTLENRPALIEWDFIAAASDDPADMLNTCLWFNRLSI